MIGEDFVKIWWRCKSCKRKSPPKKLRNGLWLKIFLRNTDGCAKITEYTARQEYDWRGISENLVYLLSFNSCMWKSLQNKFKKCWVRGCRFFCEN